MATKKKEYISATNTAPTLYITDLLTLLIAAKVWNWASWSYGVIWSVYVIVLIANVLRIFTEAGVNVVDR